jgi:hypothetical protein
MRIGFLFNHYFTHQVPHAAPYAFELSRRHPEHEVIVACSSRAEERAARRIATLYPGHLAVYHRLHLPLALRYEDLKLSKSRFKKKKWILEQNLDFFHSLDALVAPERHCYMLRKKLGVDRLTLIHTRHGAGDRKGGFDRKSGQFDLTLLPGQKYVDRLRALDLLAQTSWIKTGWPKFDVMRGLAPRRRRLFWNDRPIVVYNPHFDKKVSSWARMGLEVLEFFRRSRDWNLIFAPHVVLFKRRKRHKGRLPWRYRLAPNILVDTRSERLTDMTYMLAADIYLGDVSSQVYEFLLEPRPCVFLDAHGVAWQDDPAYAHWRLGQVVGNVEAELDPALRNARALQERFEPLQREAFAYTFHDEPGSTAAERGADAIAAFLDGERRLARSA